MKARDFYEQERLNGKTGNITANENLLAAMNNEL